MVTELSERIESILERVALAARKSGRQPEEITLVAVSKTKPLDIIVEAASTGLVRHFGENRVQEGQVKIPAFPDELKPSCRWHLIGHLQRNKARKALELFHLIESLDSLELAAALERICAETDSRASVLMEVNSSAEEAKTGIAMSQAPALMDYLGEKCPHLDPLGLMTIGPLNGDEVAVRGAFAQTRELLQALRRSSGLALPVLSMGMSGDFEWAIEEGSTEVRVGSSIFGQRQ